MANVTPVKWGITGKEMGEFHCDEFNLFNEDDRKEYARLRTVANDASSGITIENIREYSRKIVVEEIADEGKIVTTKDDIILVVSYWDKSPRKSKGDTDEEVEEAGAEWRQGRAARE